MSTFALPTAGFYDLSMTSQVMSSTQLAARHSGFFRAARSENYRFLISSDDAGELLMNLRDLSDADIAVIYSSGSPGSSGSSGKNSFSGICLLVRLCHNGCLVKLNQPGTNSSRESELVFLKKVLEKS